MQVADAFSRPALTFAVALTGCSVYFAVLFTLFASMANSGSRVSGITHLIAMAVPVALSGWFHAATTRRLALSQVRRSIQVVSAALGAPLIAWYLVGFAWVIISGEGF